MGRAQLMNRYSRSLSPRRHRCRYGQVLVEFALVALVLYLLLASILEFGRLLFVAQTVHAAADFAARELARTPLPAAATIQEALEHEDARKVYDEHFLVIFLDHLPDDVTLMEYVATMPPVNQQLFPLMVLSHVNGERVLRYPGALVEDTQRDDDPASALNNGLLVKVPVLLNHVTVQWHDVLEGMVQDTVGTSDPFHVGSTHRGLVALRVHYPFQAASMSGFRPRVTESGENDTFAGNVDRVIDADDSVIIDSGLPNGAQLVTPDIPPGADYGGTYGGAYGLGEQGALARSVRPYRKVISANGIARREVFLGSAP